MNTNSYPNTEFVKISRTGIESFMRCQRCTWLASVKKVKAPPSFPFNLNSAVDHLLKNEFNHYRNLQSVHPLLLKNGLNLIPFNHPSMDDWRSNFVGVKHSHRASGFLVYGALDDIWVDSDNVLYVVDYKATSKDSQVSLDAPWQVSYHRQVEVYQWLLRQNGFSVSNTAYFVYANGVKGSNHFNDKLDFITTLLSHQGDTTWIEPTLIAIAESRRSSLIPKPSPECKYCQYILDAIAFIKPEGSQEVSK